MVSRTQTRGLLRLPGAWNDVETFSTTAFERALSPGRRILLNATPGKGLSGPTSDRPQNAECNAPPNWVVVAPSQP
jgi:hypothetical protein